MTRSDRCTNVRHRSSSQTFHTSGGKQDKLSWFHHGTQNNKKLKTRVCLLVSQIAFDHEWLKWRKVKPQWRWDGGGAGSSFGPSAYKGLLGWWPEILQVKAKAIQALLACLVSRIPGLLLTSRPNASVQTTSFLEISSLRFHPRLFRENHPRWAIYTFKFKKLHSWG